MAKRLRVMRGLRSIRSNKAFSKSVCIKTLHQKTISFLHSLVSQVSHKNKKNYKYEKKMLLMIKSKNDNYIKKRKRKEILET